MKTVRDIFLVLTFLFYCGAVLGWCLEFLFRNLISHKGPRGKYFINPGFCKGPYLPIYGIGLSAMCTISVLVSAWFPNLHPVFVILIIGAVMIGIEFIGGLLLLKNNIRLWDYRDRPGNIMGIVCPLFSLIWMGVGAAYYLLIHKMVIGWIYWLSQNLEYCFVVGLFWGIFIIDFCTSRKEAKIIKEFGDNHAVIVKYEELKALIQKSRQEASQKATFFNQLPTDKKEDINETLEKHEEAYESRATGVKSHRSKKNRKKNRKERKNSQDNNVK